MVGWCRYFIFPYFCPSTSLSDGQKQFSTTNVIWNGRLYMEIKRHALKLERREKCLICDIDYGFEIAKDSTIGKM